MVFTRKAALGLRNDLFRAYREGNDPTMSFKDIHREIHSPLTTLGNTSYVLIPKDVWLKAACIPDIAEKYMPSSDFCKIL